MRTNRVYVDLALRAGHGVLVPDSAAWHLGRVLRLRAGDAIVLFNGDGCDYRGEILKVGRGGVAVQIADSSPPEPNAPLEIHLGVGVSKGERMDFTLQKAVELGVSSVAPLFTERSVVRLDGERLTKRESHWRGVVIAACEQSGRRRVPGLLAARSLQTWLGTEHPGPLLLDHRGEATLPGIAPPGEALTFLIGPEGGLAPEERRRALEAGFRAVRLGPRILRTETAPLAALAIVQALWGDLRS